jgi:type IX secretion system PorP/SprF family membrane protein
MRLAISVLAISFTVLGFRVQSQNLPVYNSFYANPFLYNPASVATEDTYVFLHHRQQWLGVEGSPVLSSVSINSLIDRSRTGLGFKASSYKRGLLNTTDFTFAYAHGVPITKKSHLFLGLSGGAITNAVDIANASDPNDPALLSYQANNLQPAASAGFLFRAESGINIGITLPQLFGPTFIDSSFTSINVTPVDNIIASFGYRKVIKDKLVNKKIRSMKTRAKMDAVAPLELYILYKYSAYGTSQFEGLAKLNLNRQLWVGASYRQSYGFTANAGFNINRLSIGYSFELGSQPEQGFSQGTHEVFLSLRIGDKKTFKMPSPLLRSALKAPVGPQHHARFQSDVDDPNRELLAAKSEPKKQFYVVTRSFIDFAAADKYKKSLLADKFNAEVYYYPKDKRYYVYTFSTTKSSEAYEEVRNLKNYTKIKDAKVLVVEEKKDQ